MKRRPVRQPRTAAVTLRIARSTRPAGRTVATVMLVVATHAAVALAADPPGTPSSREALARCHRAQVSDAEGADATLADSLKLADQAVAQDDRDALAHFARFCALGEQARLSGASISSLLKIRPIREAVERTLVLAPDFPDALLGKGALLVSLPGLLGGDDEEGERLVRRSLEVDPEFVDARLFLAETLLKDGRRDDARMELERARASAERKGDDAGLARARRIQAEIDAAPD